MKAEDIKRLRSLLEKATPGPWTTETPEQSLGSIDTADGNIRVAQTQEVSVADRVAGSPRRQANAALIAEAINALPSLLALYDAVMGAPELTVREVGGSLIASSLPNMHNLKVGDRVRLVPDCGDTTEAKERT